VVPADVSKAIAEQTATATRRVRTYDALADVLRDAMRLTDTHAATATAAAASAIAPVSAPASPLVRTDVKRDVSVPSTPTATTSTTLAAADEAPITIAHARDALGAVWRAMNHGARTDTSARARVCVAR
jgi:hypothetical protein